MLFSNALAYMIPNDDHSSQNMFAYNVRSWPTAISSPLFRESLCYNQASGNALPRYGGDISSLSTTVLMDDSPGTNEYAYDKNGNMVKNLDKNISEIKYNVLNLPSQITTGADKEYKITYTYDALGRKLQAYYRRKTMDVIIPKRQQAKSITLSSRFDGIIGKPVLPDTLVKDTMSTAPSEAQRQPHIHRQSCDSTQSTRLHHHRYK